MYAFYSPRTIFTALDNAVKSFVESTPIRFRIRLLSIARSWSQTATEFCPAEGTGVTIGGRGVAAVERGTTTTVLLALFMALIVRITAGRSFCISLPCAGSKLTHQTSPRCISISTHIHILADTIGNTGVMPFFHFGIERLVLFHRKGGNIVWVFRQRKRIFQRLGQKIVLLWTWNSLPESIRKVIRYVKHYLHRDTPVLSILPTSKGTVNYIRPHGAGRRYGH